MGTFQSKVQCAEGNSVLITGASSGIGKATAISLAQQGLTVFAGIRKHEDALKLAEAHQNILPLRLDVTDPEAIQEAYRIVSSKVGNNGLSALINNAGFIVIGPVEFVPLEKWAQQMDVNLYGVIRMIQTFLPLLRQGEVPGRIITIGSMAGTVAMPLFAAYSCSKFALEGLCDSLRLELNHFGVDVVLIKPGPVRTEIFENTAKTTQDLEANYPQQVDHLYGVLMRKRLEASQKAKESACEVEEVVKVIQTALFAQKPQPRYLVGKHMSTINLLRHCVSDTRWDNLTLKRLGLNTT